MTTGRSTRSRRSRATEHIRVGLPWASTVALLLALGASKLDGVPLRIGRSYKEENYMEGLSDSFLGAAAGLFTDPKLSAQLQ